MQALFADLERFQLYPYQALAEGEGYTYKSEVPVDFVAHLIVHQFRKIYRNEVLLRTSASADLSTPATYEVLSHPAITARFELRLIDLNRGEILWSAMRDSTLVVPHDQRLFLYNPEKYPGWTHPDLLREYLAEVIRLQYLDPLVGSALSVADLWFLSDPADDVETAQHLLTNLINSFYTEIDGNLPLEGRITAVFPDSARGEVQAQLDLGARHGLTPRLRLEVWRPSDSPQKVGQVEVVQVDSTHAVVRLRRLEKPFRQRGESLLPDDRVISRKRASGRRRSLL